jgi:transcriptional regulator with XRE-family HTH domain
MIGDKIRLLRVEKGISEEELAVAVGVSALAIQNYEDNRWRPGTQIISRIANALQVTILDLVEECDAICDQDGDIILVKKNCGCQLRVVGAFKK